MDQHKTVVGEVADEDTHYPEGQPKVSRDLDDGEDLRRRELEDATALCRLVRPVGRSDTADERLERKVDPLRARAATSERVGAHHP
jgi:hypothetical protein